MIKLTIITSDEEKHFFDVTEDNKSMLDLAEDAGIELPFSCRAGACYSCVCKKEKWENFFHYAGMNKK